MINAVAQLLVKLTISNFPMVSTVSFSYLDFKEIVIVVHVSDNVISFKELHGKLVELEAFFKRDESRSKPTLIPFNYTHGNDDKNQNPKNHQT